MVAVILILGLSGATGFCAEVPSETARLVARGVLRHHVALFGHWNGSLAPSVGDIDFVQYDSEAVAFNFRVRPSGHVLVVVDDDLSPVPLYSTTSDFIPGRSGNPNAVESWIVPELTGKLRAVRDFQRRARGPAATALQAVDGSRAKDAWRYFASLSGDTGNGESSRSLALQSGNILSGAVVAPLLTTAWGQAVPYSLQTPDDSCSDSHTLTGCVATAWGQLLNYWKWPSQGQGSHSYDWNSGAGTQNLSVDFSAATYDWSNMPDVLTDASAQAEKDAVSLLLYHLGVATEMDFGCDTSGSLLWADEILDTFFKYKAMTPAANRLDRTSYSAAQWFALFKTELDADPPRPVIFTIGSDLGWHEVVVDGYQEGAADKVHINFGWDGSYDGHYDVSDDTDFNTSPYNWYVDDQIMVIGIEPDNSAPLVEAGSDQSVDEATEVTLSGNASDLEGDDIVSYRWTQVSGTAAAIANPTASSTTITTPNVHGETPLVFQLRADDANRAYGTDTVTITVSNTDGSVPPPVVSSSGGGSSGGCFIASLPSPQSGRVRSRFLFP